MTAKKFEYFCYIISWILLVWTLIWKFLARFQSNSGLWIGDVHLSFCASVRMSVAYILKTLRLSLGICLAIRPYCLQWFLVWEDCGYRLFTNMYSEQISHFFNRCIRCANLWNFCLIFYCSIFNVEMFNLMFYFQHCMCTLCRCALCKKTCDQHLLAHCDNCKLYYHLGCLDPPLTRMPKKTKMMGW